MNDTSSEVTTTPDAPLSMNEAINAMTELDKAEAVPEDQAETGEEQDEGEAPADDELPPDEDGEEEDGESGDEEDQADEEAETEDEEDEPEAGQGRFVADDARVKLPDGTIVTVSELKAGSLKNADYTQKTQALAAEKQTFQSEREQFNQTQQQTVQVRDFAIQLLESFTPQPPDPALLKSDPLGYLQQEQEYKARTEQLSYLQQQKAYEAQQAQMQQQQQAQEHAQKEWAALAQAVPDLKDQAKAAAFFSGIEAYATSLGYTVPQLQEAISFDHRQALVLADAVKWRQLQASKAKVSAKVEGRPPVQKGGKRLNPGQHQHRQKQAAMDKLKRSGGVKDAAAAILALEGKG